MVRATGVRFPVKSNFIFKKNLKLEVRSRRVDKELIYGPKQKFDNDEFGITRVLEASVTVINVSMLAADVQDAVFLVENSQQSGEDIP